MSGWVRPKGSESAFSWVFGFAGQAQFGLIAGDPSSLTDTDRERLYAITRAVSNSSVGLTAATGIVDRLRGWDVVAVGIPIDVVEAFSGRKGISVVLCCGAARGLHAGPAFFVQAMSALRNTIDAVVSSRGSFGATEFEALALSLQDTTQSNLEPLNENLEKALKVLNYRLSLLALTHRRRRGILRRRIQERTEKFPPSVGAETLSMLCYTLMQGMAFDRSAQFGYFMPLCPPYGELPAAHGKLTVSQYFEHGAFVCRRWSGELSAEENGPTSDKSADGQIGRELG